MKALCLYFHVMPFVSHILEKEIGNFGRNLSLITFGSERVNPALNNPALMVTMMVVWSWSRSVDDGDRDSDVDDNDAENNNN